MPYNESKDFAQIANQYCLDVTSGKILACEWIKLACKRHLKDLEKSKSKAFRYKFDSVLANRICEFAELMIHIKGPLQGERLTVEPWQAFILTSLVGWVDKETGLRRFSFAYIEVARKNGKSFLGAALGLYFLLLDGEGGAEVYSAGSSDLQSREVWGVAKKQVEFQPNLQAAFGVAAWANSITVESTASKFTPLTGKPKHGSNPSFAIADEVHQHRDSYILDTIRSGMKGRSQPLLVCITTAGSDVHGVAYRTRQDLQQILEGIVDDERFFGVIYTIDEDDDWVDNNSILKANPNAGISVSLQELYTERDRAARDLHLGSVFKNLHLNVYTSASKPYFDAIEFQKQGNSNLSVRDFENNPDIQLYVGIDYASSQDLSSVVACFMYEGQLHIFPEFFLPSAAADQVRVMPYRELAAKGYITLDEGPVMDERFLEDHIRYLHDNFNVAQFVFDKWNLAGMGSRLIAEGFPMVSPGFTVKNLSSGMKFLRDKIVLGKVVHDSNPIMTWNVSNVESKEDKNKNDYPTKSRNENKIDGAVAAIMACNAISIAPPDVSPQIFL